MVEGTTSGTARARNKDATNEADRLELGREVAVGAQKRRSRRLTGHQFCNTSLAAAEVGVKSRRVCKRRLDER